MQLTKPEVLVLAQAVALGEVSYHYLSPEFREARELVSKGMLTELFDKADFTHFEATAKANERFLG